MSPIALITMPKWGLSMQEGKVNGWLKQPGETVRVGDEVVEVESDKIAGAVESRAEGLLRRQVAKPEDVLPVGGLLGVVAAAEVADADIDAAVTDFLANFKVEVAAAAESGPQPEKVAVGTRSLRYLKLGEGSDVVLLLHGFGGDLNNWLFNHAPLAEKRTVYALDLPGHGESTKDVGSGTLDELTQAVLGFMDATGIESAHLVGHSLGGAVAIKAAAAAPKRVRSLTLICSAGLGSEIDSSYIEGFVSAANRNALKPHAAKLFADSNLVTRQLIDDLLKYKRIEGVDACLRKLSTGLFPGGKQTEVLRDTLGTVGKPVMVICGEQDSIIPPRHADGLPPTVKVERIAKAGHMAMMEAPHEVNRLIDRFLG